MRDKKNVLKTVLALCLCFFIGFCAFILMAQQQTKATMDEIRKESTQVVDPTKMPPRDVRVFGVTVQHIFVRTEGNMYIITNEASPYYGILPFACGGVFALIGAGAILLTRAFMKSGEQK